MRLMSDYITPVMHVDPNNKFLIATLKTFVLSAVAGDIEGLIIVAIIAMILSQNYIVVNRNWISNVCIAATQLSSNRKCYFYLLIRRKNGKIVYG